MQSKSRIPIGLIFQLGQLPQACMGLRSWLGACTDPSEPLELYKMALIKAHQR